MNRSDTICDLAQALAAFHAAAKNPKNDRTAEIRSERTGKAYTYGYPDFAAMIEEQRPLLAEHGLSVAQELLITPGVVGAATTIMHESGQWLELAPAYIPAGEEAKDYGIAANYSRRYAYMAAFNLAGAADGTTPPQGKRAGAGPGPASEAQQRKIHVEAEAASIGEAALQAFIAKQYQSESLKDLSKAQASDLIERLIAEKERLIAEKERLATAAKAGADPETGEVAAQPAVDPDDGRDFWPQDADEAPGMDAEGARQAWAEREEPAQAPPGGML